MSTRSKIINIVSTCQEDLLKAWVKEQLTATTLRTDLLSEQELREQSREFLDLFRKALEAGNVTDITAAPWSGTRVSCESLSVTGPERFLAHGDGHVHLLAQTARLRPSPGRTGQERRDAGRGDLDHHVIAGQTGFIHR